ncbi:MAG: mycothiol conjugate amidase Mca [Actinobacteria bacterium]|nr:mycothiol conjugate amidase Mca [Actinomycetota bacterium]
MSESLPARRLLTVHAHPDDEASKGSALVAKYAAEGVRSTLVCCTGGELGEILNPAMNRPEIAENLAEVRSNELDRSASIIGFHRVERLGYRDSGMPDMVENADPANFWNAPLVEATKRLVALIRREQPQVLITYDERGGYPHPDHLKTHAISVEAFEWAAEPHWFPELGEPWQVSKLYYSVFASRRALSLHNRMLEMGIESPFTEEWLARYDQDHRITTSVDVSAYMHIRDQSLLAHATQVDPNEKFWFGLSAEEQAAVYPWDDYILAKSHVETEVPETDLFAGL